MLGTRPADIVPFVDINRFAELLVDGKTQVAAKTSTDLNASPFAIAQVQAAENDIVEAVRTKQYYTLQQLRDLVRNYQLGGVGGFVAGTQIITLIADLAWTHALQRKRYAEGTPQADDPSVKRGQDLLQQLKTGSRIFILEGVQQTDGLGNVIGIYGGQEKPTAGIMSGHTLHSDVGRPSGVWGDLPHSHWRDNWHPLDWEDF